MRKLTIAAAILLALSGCAATPQSAAICAAHRDAAIVAAVDEVTGLSAKEQAEKKLALDVFCSSQAAAPK